MARGAAEIGGDAAVEVLALRALPPGGKAGADPFAEGGDLIGGLHVVRRRGEHGFAGERLAAVFHVEEGDRDLEDVVHQHAPGPGAVRQFAGEAVLRHLAGQPEGGFQHVVVARAELGRGQLRAGIRVEAEKLHDIADDLGDDEFVTARDHGQGTRAEAAQQFLGFLVFQHVDRLELDPTDREEFFYPEAAGSVRLPEYFDRLGHGVSVAG